MSDLFTYFSSETGRPIHKLAHYFACYERHFSRYRGKKPVILEIGVKGGGSLQMWREYFGADARIIGTDINPACKVMEADGFEILIGDQGDPKFWTEVKATLPKFDILIDDGSHDPAHQRETFDCMYDHVADDGVYWIEDCYTSYSRRFGGGHRGRQTFIEFCKDLVDELYGYWSRLPTLPITQLTRTCSSIHFYDSIVVFEKRLTERPQNVFKGEHPWKNKFRREVPLPPISTLPRAGATRRRLAARHVKAPD